MKKIVLLFIALTIFSFACTAAAQEDTGNELDYLAFLEISDISIRYCNTYTEGKKAGLQSIKIKNNGVQTVESIDIVFYFLDNSNVRIYEDEVSFYKSDFGFILDFPALKPNYIYNFVSTGTFRSFANVPEDWQEGNIEYEVTQIHLAR